MSDDKQQSAKLLGSVVTDRTQDAQLTGKAVSGVVVKLNSTFEAAKVLGAVVITLKNRRRAAIWID